MSIKELRTKAAKYNVDITDCVEKIHLVEKLAKCAEYIAHCKSTHKSNISNDHEDYILYFTENHDDNSIELFQQPE